MASLLVFVVSADAATPAGEDQYLEQVPEAGGGSGQKSDNEDFAESLGGSDGTVTEANVKAAARKADTSEGREGSASTESAAGAPNESSPVEGAATAVKSGPLSPRSTVALIAMILVLVGGILVIRRRQTSVAD